MESREHLVKQVAKTIEDNHGKHHESFIFGISGKWGEGKTKFLTDLEAELQGKYEVATVNPWKFASDKVSFLRNFLKALSEIDIDTKPYDTDLSLSRRFRLIACSVRNTFNKLKCRINGEKYKQLSSRNFQDLYYDKTKNTINWVWLSFIIIITLVAFAYYEYGITEAFKADHQLGIHRLKVLFTVLAIPIAVAMFGRLIVVKRASRSIETLDRFDKLLDGIIDDFGKRKIVIFVDDLDRVTPQVAREVLDNLRTFFDRKELTFVVTGDHTVLERHLGKDILPGDEEPEQMEEGRRFLKKIFNVYWRLPLPLSHEFKKALDEIADGKKDDLDSIFKESGDKEKFLLYLEKYFERNFRQVHRFIDTVIFTFQAISSQLEQVKKENKEYFEELIQRPLLVVRTLMIQDLCNPLFEDILRNNKILVELEYAVERKDTQKIEQIIQEHELSQGQKDFIKNFIYEEPRFFEDSALTVRSMLPFLHLAADASLGDERGLSAADFIEKMREGNPEHVKNALLSSGREKLNDEAVAVKDTFDQTEDVNQKNSDLTTLLKALGDIPKNHPSQKIFSDKLVEVDIGFLEPGQRVETYIEFWKWLDLLDSAEVIDRYADKFTHHAEDDQVLNLSEGGSATTRMLTRWLASYYDRDPNTALTKMSEILQKFAPKYLEDIQKALENITEKIAINLVQNEDNRDLRFEILSSYTSDGLEKLNEKVFENLSGNENLWQWSVGKTLDEEPPWTQEELQSRLFESIKGLTNSSELENQFIFLVGKVTDPILIGEIWDYLSGDGFAVFEGALHRIATGLGGADALAPDTARAIKLFERITTKITEIDDEPNKQGWLGYLNKSLWIWRNLSEMPEKEKIVELRGVEGSSLYVAANSVLESWGEADEPEPEEETQE